jgi:CheY-like chemotaxis protein
MPHMDKKKIFFIEDVEDITELYSDPLEKAGYTIEKYQSGTEALAQINSVAEGKVPAPKFIILDLLLSDISGLAILKAIRDKALFNDTTVVVFTNYANSELEDSIKQLPEVLYLMKVDTPPSKLVSIISLITNNAA